MKTSPNIRRSWRERLKRLLIWTVCLGLTIVTMVLGVNLWMIARTRDAVYEPGNARGLSGDCILVLGCGLRQDGTPSQMLRDRLDVGIAAYKQGVAPKLLMSGDHGRVTYDEVNAMKDYAIAQGVPSENIFMDHAGFSTYESAYRAKAVFEVKSAFLVTQKYHLYRAVFLARVMGIEAYGVAADRRDYRNDLYNNVRESLARVKDLFMAIFRPEPTYLGDSIPMWGSGSLTDDTSDYIEAGGKLDE